VIRRAQNLEEHRGLRRTSRVHPQYEYAPRCDRDTELHTATPSQLNGTTSLWPGTIRTVGGRRRPRHRTAGRKSRQDRLARDSSPAIALAKLASMALGSKVLVIGGIEVVDAQGIFKSRASDLPGDGAASTPLDAAYRGRASPSVVGGQSLRSYQAIHQDPQRNRNQSCPGEVGDRSQRFLTWLTS
jgi:hypothetical protein